MSVVLFEYSSGWLQRYVAVIVGMLRAMARLSLALDLTLLHTPADM